MELERTLSIGYRAVARPLNPLAPVCAHQPEQSTENKQDCKDPLNLKGEWKEVYNGRKKMDGCQHAHSYHNDIYKNRCKVLQSNDEEHFDTGDESNPTITIKSKEAEDVNAIEHLDADRITIDKLDQLMQQCNENRIDGVQCRSEGEKAIRREYEGLESHIDEAGEELSNAHLASHCHRLISYLNRKEHLYEKAVSKELHGAFADSRKKHNELHDAHDKQHDECDEAIEERDNLQRKCDHMLKKNRELEVRIMKRDNKKQYEGNRQRSRYKHRRAT